MKDDATLLQCYARDRSESDFAELVQRHVNLVYSSALRQMNGDTHLAQDVTQLVFTDLARKAASLASHRVLAGWLFTSTRFAAAKLVRGEQRRRQREQEAQSMQEISASDQAASIDWEHVRPVLDDALAELGERDREAILLRYMEGRDFTQVGARLSLSENAARMRVDRAVEKLRSLLTSRGITSTTAALALTLSSHAVAAVPVGLAVTITGTALAGVAVTGSAATLTFMSMTKLQIAIATAVVVTGSGVYALQEKNNDALRTELAALQQSSPEIEQLRAKNSQLTKEVRETAALRVNEAELERLRQEAVAVSDRIDTTARAAAGPIRPKLVGDAHPLKELDRRPMLTRPASPVYPAKMAQAGIAGDVTVEMIIDTKGNVASARVLRSSQSEFEEAAIMAVVQWKFDPGQKNGRNVNTRATQLIQFDPKEGVRAPSPDWF